MVLLTLKNLQQQTFNVEIELSASVKELKEKIEKENGSDYPAEGQKLIYAGKILQDDSNLETYNIDTKKFLVIMVSKPKSAPPSRSGETSISTRDESSSSTSAQVEETTEGNVPAASPAVTTSSTTTTTSSTAGEDSGTGENAESLVVLGEEFNKMVENIMEMGYGRSEVERALRASFNNPYTAVQYLVDGIPPNLESGGDADSGEAEERPVTEESEEDQLEFLRSQPQFNQMRQMIRTNPQLLDALIQQIGQTNPELLQIIQQNQEAFVRMLNESPSGGGGGDSTGSTGTTPPTGTAPSGTPRPGAPGQNTIVISSQDRDAIDRLKALGNFPEDVVVQAYFACEKNENLAAEFLFSQSWD